MVKAKRRGGISGIAKFAKMTRRDSVEVVAVEPGGAVPHATEKSWKADDTDATGRATDGTGWMGKYDASGLVPHYTQADHVPERLKKYFSQRYRFFSLYSTPPGCLLDEEGWYSVTPELIADQIANRCRCDTVLDSFCGVGGNAIAFAKTCERVIAMDTSPTRLALARHNAQIYGVADRIEFVLSDFISFARNYGSLPSSTRARKIDVVFLSPPWGGPSYLDGSSEDLTQDGTSIQPPPGEEHPHYSLSSIRPVDGPELFGLARTITRNVAYYLPRNTRVEEVGALLLSEAAGRVGEGLVTTGPALPQERVEIEEEWMGNKLKALTCYFGGLVQGQEDQFGWDALSDDPNVRV